MIVTIDGPAGAGKSSVAHKLAEALGFFFLDTGAMYRCVTLACLRAEIDLQDTSATLAIARGCKIEMSKGSVKLNHLDVTREIRNPLVAKSIKPIAGCPAIRELMVQEQRRICSNIDCKIFLTATPEERARRRFQQLLDNDMDADYDEILRQQNERDANDSNRQSGPLKAAGDAIVVYTDGLTEQQVLEKLLEIVRVRTQQVPS